MKNRPPERHTTFFDLLDALAQRGCALCALTARAAHRYLDAMLSENVNDPGTRAFLAESLGFCAAHARQGRDMQDALGIAILYEPLLRAASQRIARGETLLTGSCPVCRAEADAAQRYAREFGLHLGEADFRRRFLDSDGFCLPHFQRVYQLLDEKKTRAWLVLHQVKTLETLAEQLRQFVEKHDYRHRSDFGPEADAWQRALDKLAGRLP